MTTAEPPNSKSSSGYAVPLGWVAFIAGILGVAGSILIRFGVLPETDYPVGVLGMALFVGGYLACFVIPPLHRRVSALEERLNNIENKRTHEDKPKEPAG